MTEGTQVRFDFGTGLSGTGKIRGQSSRGLVNMWIVEIEQVVGMPEEYAYSCIVVPESLLRTILPCGCTHAM